ncbi:tripartite tricarboxylate transporter substrate binding protein [Vannielia litorea]|uniref:Tripartite-type tricarboxylate transporter, receptor component TctC n=1 Tax=Vannielia litorea TaxID=1217970 RepID=A0A1N6E0B9_9RHOB|nr:tripartite tricarboxylate transporter substrate binding protein [Vannielia litorea]SIN76468.1 Tripartite-type tricarboxylate transporter, receptor component TctC [Vannielia litorea]
MKRRTLLTTITAAMAGLALAGPATAQDFPSDTIRLIVPYPPGGGSDSITRAFGAALEEVSGQAVVVENIPGSEGINGMLALKNAAPDGYTIAMNGSSDVTAPLAFRDQPPYELSDFSCAGAIFKTPAWIVSHADNGYEDLGDFLEAAKEKPGELILGTTGKLSATDFVASTVKGTSGADFKVVPFGGGGPLRKAVMANQVDAGVILAPVFLPEIQAGELNVLAAAGDMSEINYEPARATKHIKEWGADIEVALIRGIWMPAGVPEDVQAKMSELVSQAIKSESFTAFGENFGFGAHAMSGADFCARLPQEVEDLKTVLSKYVER